jgi:hypothetical protein
MAEYHGDLMYKVGTIYAREDDRNYPVAILLALLLGPLGMHRFFLGDMRVAYFYFVPFSICALMSFALIDFTLLLWFCGIATIPVLGEIIYFAVCWARR